MMIGRFFKAPGDRKRYVVDYIDWLDRDETITAVNIQSLNGGTFVVDGYVTGSQKTNVIFYASGGVEDDEHVARITINTSLQQTKVDEVTFIINSERRNP